MELRKYKPGQYGAYQFQDAKEYGQMNIKGTIKLSV